MSMLVMVYIFISESVFCFGSLFQIVGGVNMCFFIRCYEKAVIKEYKSLQVKSDICSDFCTI